MSHDDFAFEPVRGLPATLPDGEELLWQGTPDWRAMAIRAYHARKVAVYFLALILVRIGFGVTDGTAVASLAVSCLWIATLGAVAAGTLALLAYLNSRMTVYSVTSERILIRHGIAVPMTVNIPFALIQSADLKQHANGVGEIFFSLPAVFFQRRNSILEFFDASELFLFSPAQTFDLSIEPLVFLVL